MVAATYGGGYARQLGIAIRLLIGKADEFGEDYPAPSIDDVGIESADGPPPVSLLDDTVESKTYHDEMLFSSDAAFIEIEGLTVGPTEIQWRA